MRLPLHTLKVGSYGTHNALGLAKFKRARFLLASTSEVYGDPQVHPQPESYWGNVNPIGPRGVYDEAKRYAEALTMAYHRQQGVDTCIARIFNTYGSRMRPHDGRAVPTFLRQAVEGKPVTVFGDGQQTRSFCYVDDLIRGIYSLAMSAESLPMNLGNPEERTLLELAEDRDQGGRILLADRLRSASDRRSAGPSAGHHRGRARRLAGSRRCRSRRVCSARSRPFAPGLRPRSERRRARLVACADPLLVRAARLEQVERTPVWYMRQAGRSLPEYRAIRAKHDLFAICRQPELCAEVTLQPVGRHGVDAAVIYSDIVLPVTGMGVSVSLVEGVGPVLDVPLRTAGDLRRLRPLHPEQALPWALDSIRLVRRGARPGAGPRRLRRRAVHRGRLSDRGSAEPDVRRDQALHVRGTRPLARSHGAARRMPSRRMRAPRSAPEPT